MKNKDIIKLLCGAIISVSACSLQADEYHYNNMLIGDRASGLGGAYTAISDDAAGLYYNPAGIVFADELKLSASVSAINKSQMTYEDVFGSQDWVRSSSSFVPNFFGITQQLGPGYFGFSYVVTNSDIENQDTEINNIPGIPFALININNRDTTFKIGPSYAIKLSSSLNFGATLYFHQREREFINNQWIRLSTGGFEWSNRYFETDETGVNPIIGLVWSPSDIMSIGFTVRKTFLSSSKSAVQNSCSSDINLPAIQSPLCIPVLGTANDPLLANSDEKRNMPLNIRLGVAYFPTNKFLLDVDFSYYEETFESGDFVGTEETINLAAGLEYYYSSNWAFRGGLYTNNSNTPDIETGVINQRDHVDLTGLSLSLTRFTKSSSVTAGFTYSSGSGSAQVLAGNPDIQDLDYTAQTFYLSTSYQF